MVILKRNSCYGLIKITRRFAKVHVKQAKYHLTDKQKMQES